jgi:hypothetical protein
VQCVCCCCVPYTVLYQICFEALLLWRAAVEVSAKWKFLHDVQHDSILLNTCPGNVVYLSSGATLACSLAAPML